MSKTVWLIDNGHSGIVNGKYLTPGKRSPLWDDGTQLFEGVYNRELVSKIIRYCLSHNILFYNIVPELLDISLGTRVKRANKINARCNTLSSDYHTVYLSVHGNAGGGTGWEVWTSPGETISDMIAGLFFDEFEKGISPFKMRKSDNGHKEKEAKFTVLTDTNMPALLTENLFYDKYTPDYKFMSSEIGKNLISLLHIKSMLSWERRDYVEVIPSTIDVLPITNCEDLKSIKL